MTINNSNALTATPWPPFIRPVWIYSGKLIRRTGLATIRHHPNVVVVVLDAATENMSPDMMKREGTPIIVVNDKGETTAEKEAGTDIGEQALSTRVMDTHCQTNLWSRGERKTILTLADVITRVTGLLQTLWKGIYFLSLSTRE